MMKLAALTAALFISQAAVAPAHAEIQFGVSAQLPGVSINLGLPAQPAMALIPGLPVYYAPHVRANYFFYDGLYWVLHGDDWYFSSWFGGPWYAVDPYDVPDFILRIPVRYFPLRPHYFLGWHPESSPRWGDHWGHDWSHRRRGWDHWDRRHLPAVAPLPEYQRRFPAHRYPDTDRQQRAIRGVNEHYHPREARTREAIERQQRYQQVIPQRRVEPAREPRIGQHTSRRMERREPGLQQRATDRHDKRGQGGHGSRRPDAERRDRGR